MTLSIGGRDFPTRNVSASWHLMQFSRAQAMIDKKRPHVGDQACEKVFGEICERCQKVLDSQDKGGMMIMTAMYNACMSILRPEVRDEFEDYMNEVELAPGELEQAIASAVAGAGGEVDLPEEEGKGTEEASPSASSGSSPKTSEPSRVVSFGPDVRVVPAAS